MEPCPAQAMPAPPRGLKGPTRLRANRPGAGPAIGRWRVRCAAIAAFALLPAVSTAATLQIELAGIGNARGLVRVAVCTPATFTTENCPYFAAASAQPGTVIVEVAGILPGRYAVQAFHDVDGTGRVRTNLLGLSTEAIGFSRDAPVRFGPPSFADAAITVSEPRAKVQVLMRVLAP